jgi:hypothetical protein
VSGDLELRLRESIGRCEARWLAAGVDSELAAELAADSEIGRPPPHALPSATEPLRVIQSVVGAGKSLIGERALQAALRQRIENGDAPLACWLQARNMEADLKGAVLAGVAATGDLESDGALIVLDGVDEAGLGRAEELFEEARTLVRTYEGLEILITTRPLPPFIGAEEVVAVHELSETEALSTVSTVARRQVGLGDAYRWPVSLRQAIRRPLFAVLLGVFFREGEVAPPPPARLLGRVIEKAVGRTPGSDWGLLRKVAARAIDEGGAGVARGVAGGRGKEEALAETRLVTVSEKELRFPLIIVAQWFAAEGIAVGETSVEALIDAPERLELWRYPLAIAIGAFGGEHAERVLAALAERQSGFASQVVEEGLSRWSLDGEGVGDGEGAARGVRWAMQSWLLGLGPLAELCGPLDGEGRLAPIGYHAEGERFDTGWYLGAEGSGDVRRLPGDTWAFMSSGGPSWEERAGWQRLRGAAAGGEPSWQWRWAFEDLRNGLSEVLKNRRLNFLEGPLRQHRLWVLARWVLHRNWLDREPIEVQAVLDEIDSRLAGAPDGFVAVELIPDPQRGAFEAALDDGIMILTPELQGPRPDFPGGNSWDAWDADGHLRRTKRAYELALTGFEHLVGGRFAELAPWMQTASTLPAVLHIEIDFNEHPDVGGFASENSWLDPLPEGSESRVEASLAEVRQWDAERWQGQVQKLRRLRPRQARWIGVVHQQGVLDIDEENCVEELIYKWLWDDLSRIKWVSGMLGTRRLGAGLGP